MFRMIVFLTIIAASFFLGRLPEKILNRVNSVRFGPSEFTGQSITRANKLEHYLRAVVQADDVLVYGDSLIALSDLAEISDDSRLLNRGISGDRISGITERIYEGTPPIFAETFIMVGINDLISSRSEAEIEIDLRALRDKLCQSETPVFWLSVLPVNPEKFRREILSRTSTVHLPTRDEVASINHTIATAVGDCPQIKFVNITDHFLDASGDLNALLTIDGLHLSSEGAQLLTSIVIETAGLK